MSLGPTSINFYYGLGCVSEEVIFGLRKGDELSTLSCMGFALNSNSYKCAI